MPQNNDFLRQKNGQKIIVVNESRKIKIEKVFRAKSRLRVR